MIGLPSVEGRSGRPPSRRTGDGRRLLGLLRRTAWIAVGSRVMLRSIAGNLSALPERLLKSPIAAGPALSPCRAPIRLIVVRALDSSVSYHRPRASAPDKSDGGLAIVTHTRPQSPQDHHDHATCFCRGSVQSSVGSGLAHEGHTTSVYTLVCRGFNGADVRYFNGVPDGTCIGHR